MYIYLHIFVCTSMYTYIYTCTAHGSQSRTSDGAAVRGPHRIIQSVGATGGVYKGQGRNQQVNPLMTHACVRKGDTYYTNTYDKDLNKRCTSTQDLVLLEPICDRIDPFTARMSWIDRSEKKGKGACVRKGNTYKNTYTNCLRV